jgi:quinol monooxygenase YgiN
MASEKVHVVRILKPALGKSHLVQGLAKSLVSLVETHEPDVLSFQIFASQEGIIVMQEFYKNAQAAWDHLETARLLEFLGMLSDQELLGEPMQVEFFMPLAGFDSLETTESNEPELEMELDESSLPADQAKGILRSENPQDAGPSTPKKQVRFELDESNESEES